MGGLLMAAAGDVTLTIGALLARDRAIIRVRTTCFKRRVAGKARVRRMWLFGRPSPPRDPVVDRGLAFIAACDVLGFPSPPVVDHGTLTPGARFGVPPRASE